MNEQHLIPCQTAYKEPHPKHHPFSPSTLQRLSMCPGSWRMSKDIPESPSSPDAAEGTRLHEAVATGNLDDLDAEQQAAVTACLDLIHGMCAAYTREYHTFSELEVKVLDDDLETVLTSGYVDFAFVRDDGTAEIVDWKFGRGNVPDADGNLQLAAYALGVMHMFGCNAVTAHIFQPRVYGHTSYTFTKPGNILANIKRIIEKAKSETIILSASDEACRYCRAASTCPACNARYGLVPADLHENMLSDPVKLLDLWERAQVASKLVDAIKARVTDYISEHGALGDWTLEQRAGKREVRDTGELYQRISGMMDSHDLAECYSVKVSALLDKLTERIQKSAEHNGVKMLKKDAKKQAEDMIGDLMVRAPGSAVLTKGAKKA